MHATEITGFIVAIASITDAARPAMPKQPVV
jgi:hypothetical protein